MTSPLVAAFWAQRPAPHTLDGQVPEWQGIVCAIGKTRPGKMYCAMCCDGAGCGAEATPARLADFARYDAARRANNRKATAEERKYRRRAANDARYEYGYGKEEEAA